MIDYYDIEIAFIPLGPDEWLRLPGHHKGTPPVNRQHIRLLDPEWMGQQRALMLDHSFRLQVCPAKVLGRWNAYGTNDLRKAVLQTVPPVLAAMGITVTREIKERLRAGEYTVREVHIAHQFHLPGHGITDFLARLRDKLIPSHDVERLQRGQGFRVNARNRRCSYLLYDKHVELCNRGLKEYERRLVTRPPSQGPGFREMGLMLDRTIQQHLAALGPRLEVRLGDQFFRHIPFASGTEWQPETAANLYQQALEKLRLPSAVSVTWARRTARRRLNQQVLKTYLLWNAGEPLDVAAGSPKTITRHARSIKEALGLDIQQPATPVLGKRSQVDPRKLFAWNNRVRADHVDLDRDLGLLNEHFPDLG